MNATELADVDRDVLTITTRGARTWFTCTSGPDEVTVGPFPTTSITGALPDPPVTGPAPAAPTRALLETALAAAMKDGKDARARAEKAEKELEQAEGALAAYVSAQASRAAQPRPLNADDIEQLVTENRYRVADAIRSLYPEEPMATDVLAHTVMTALTVPPRPEGAEEIEAWLDGMPESIRLGGDEHQRLFANHLAHMGFRVPVALHEVGLTPTNPEEQNR